MAIVSTGQFTITDLNDGINGDNGKTYILNIINGVRSITYNANGNTPSPTQTAFSCELYEDGVLKTPSSYSWSASGLLSGTSTSATFTPTCASTFSNANNAISLTVKYNGQTIKATAPIAATKIGDAGATGATGAAGKGVKSTEITYQASTSGTTPPTNTWSSSIPSVAAGQYLWTKTYITYTDSTSSTSYSVGKMGEQGQQGNAGRGISSTVTQYQVSTSGTTPPGGTWGTSVPSVAAGQFLWTRITINYTDGSTPSVSYSVGKMGEQGPQGPQGATGAPGATGAAGRSITSIVALYKKLNTKTPQAKPTSDTGWSTTPPTWEKGYYIHTCSKITYDKAPLVEYTTPLCDNSWEAVNDFNTQQNIFNTLTNNGANQGIYLENQKIYINGEYIKAGSISANQLTIGMGDGGGLSQNPTFSKWSGTYPDGAIAWSSGGISKQSVDGRNVAQFACPTSGTQYGMQLPSTFFANNVNLDGVEYFALEVKFRLTSGTSPSGAAFLFDIYATDGTYQRLQLNMSDAGATLTANTWYTVKKVFQASVAKTFKSCSGYLLANWSGAGNAVKTIQFATANVYLATKQDFLTQSWTTGTEINGAYIKTGTLDAGKITTGTLKAGIIDVETLRGKTLTAGTVSGGNISGATLTGGSLTIGSNFSVNTSGVLTASGATITGKMTATSGKIAAFTIDANNLIGTNVGMSGTSGTNMAFWAGGSTASSAPFRVSHAGALTCTNATITGGSFSIGSNFSVNTSGVLTAKSANLTGSITATSGKIATFTIDANNLIGTNVGMSGTNGTNMAFWAGGNTASSAPFRVSHAGALTCTNATITGGSLKIGSAFSVNSSGALTASGATITGNISGSNISGGSISGATISSSDAGAGTSWKMNISAAELVSSITSMNSYRTLRIFGCDLTLTSGYVEGTAKDHELTINPGVIKMVHGVAGTCAINVDGDRHIMGEPGVIMEQGLRVSGTNTQISKAGQSVSWLDGCKGTGSIINMTSQNGYSPILRQKTTNGAWALGVYTNNTMYLTYMTDTNINNGTNSPTAQFAFPANVSGTVYTTGNKPSPADIGAAASGHTHNYAGSSSSGGAANSAVYTNKWQSNGQGTSYIITGNGDDATWSKHNVIFRTHWGLGIRDYTDTCRIIIDARLGNICSKGYFLGTAFYTSSDKRLKENIIPMDERLEKMFMELNPVNYYMIDQDDKRRHNGFLAQEIEEAMTNNGIAYEEFAGLSKKINTNANEEDIPVQILNDETDKDNVEYCINYSEFTALNTHMIQKCLKRIEELEQQIKELKNN